MLGQVRLRKRMRRRTRRSACRASPVEGVGEPDASWDRMTGPSTESWVDTSRTARTSTTTTSSDLEISRLDSRRLLLHSGQFAAAESDWPPTAGVADRAVPV